MTDLGTLIDFERSLNLQAPECQSTDCFEVAPEVPERTVDRAGLTNRHPLIVGCDPIDQASQRWLLVTSEFARLAAPRAVRD